MASKPKLPWLPFYAADFLTATAGWSLEEVGAYIKLLCYQWINGYIPADEKRIANAIANPLAFNEIWHIIKDKFVEKEEGKLINLRLDEIRKEKIKKSKKASKSGSQGAASRWSGVSKRYSEDDGERHSEPNGESMTIQSQSKEIIIKKKVSEEKSSSTGGEGKETVKLKTNSSQKQKGVSAAKLFEAFRIIFPGTKRGEDIEFDNFRSKNPKTHIETVKLLVPALNRQIKWRSEAEAYNNRLQPFERDKKIHIPDWKNLSTWINKKCWTEEQQELPTTQVKTAVPIGQ